jgi:hypothetical protein
MLRTQETACVCIALAFCAVKGINAQQSSWTALPQFYESNCQPFSIFQSGR